jgi:hypothetical protein
MFCWVENSTQLVTPFPLFLIALNVPLFPDGHPYVEYVKLNVPDDVPLKILPPAFNVNAEV